MATKAMNFKFDEAEIRDMKRIADVFNMTVTDVIKEALSEYMEKMKKDPYYRLSMNVKEASKSESEEILSEIEKLTDDDLSISTVKRFKV
ncbi:MAG: hypothetical protein IJ796_07355 [Lachnospiraceae bacterium]|nr:hypothetical protein [Lachnospiraceae bacterium]